MSALRGLLFDKDGTLFDFQKTWGEWALGYLSSISSSVSHFNDLCDVLDYDPDARTFANCSVAVAGTVQDIVGRLAPVTPRMTPEALRRGIIETSSTAPLHPPVPLPPLLEELRSKNMILGVATNDSEAVARAHLTTQSIADFFTFVVGSDSGHGEKPAPGMVEAFLRQTGLAPQQTAMVGDSTHDLHAGRAAGTRTIAVLTGTATRDELAPFADIVLDHVGHIPDYLNSLNQ